MVRYHYNPESGQVGICRADPSRPNSRGCKFRLPEGEHFATAQDASRGYELTQEAFPARDSRSGRSLTAQQQSYFGSSAVRDAKGDLLEVYHGSSQDFESFDSSTLGKGNDTWGNGFYFTTQKNTADGYSEGRGSREFYLAVKNPISIDGMENSSLVDVQLTPEQNRQIILSHPDLQLQPDEDEQRSNPLGDYAEEYWDRSHHSPAQLRAMASKVVDQYFSNSGWIELESFYGKDNGQAFLKSVHSATGYDGVEVDFGNEHGKHFVAWFPEQIKLTSNREPTDSKELAN